MAACSNPAPVTSVFDHLGMEAIPFFRVSQCYSLDTLTDPSCSCLWLALGERIPTRAFYVFLNQPHRLVFDKPGESFTIFNLSGTLTTGCLSSKANVIRTTNEPYQQLKGPTVGHIFKLPLLAPPLVFYKQRTEPHELK